MRTKILMVDFDGVLNNWEGMKNGEQSHHDWLDKANLAVLKKIVEEFNPFVVVSSSWRKLHTKTELEAILLKNGLEIKLAGVTPNTFRLPEPLLVPNWGWKTYSMRGHEIQKWLDDWRLEIPNPSICILDDDSDMDHLMPFLVQTNGQFGLQEHHIDLVRKVFEAQEDSTVART